ncbi:MAG TPA: tRNA (adenosine(37)-N6)-threonylcarbamoyltransferase complex transferase subunit TsaD [Syntrophobacteraceae bacterium]|nr:tRNA (adenosine(37)-N6)-threonylcarbamoyltransferase complex transferase subunit TsaD [Syntrophobacteraceae bacterium]HBZ56599.1 tRNA (adenosine(37)-N6)-threonylcarbamoyltransferase complex transferase subunit TsaD [Syntrophobacteraceae bacterium]
MIILGIESSCDETAAAVVEDGRRILADVVSSQVAVHSPYGGVVPELASRKHVEAILPVVSQALSDAGLTRDSVDAIAVTQGPGLVGSLLVGLSAAKALGYALRKPLIAVNHLEGHIRAAFMEQDPPDGPLICLVVSGGHTSLYLQSPDGGTQCLGSTLDDAAGEAFDKVAKLLNLGYPGGVIIDRLAERGNPRAFALPRPYLGADSLDFSFSGIKTAVAALVRQLGWEPLAGTVPPQQVADLTASFQEAVVDVLVHKTFQAVNGQEVKHLAVVGGVAANARLRQRLQEEAAYQRVQLYLPALRFCTDNAVMIAAAGYWIWRRSGFVLQPGDLDARSRWN